MVVVAVQVRARLDDREVDRRPRIVCATELAVVCEAIDGDADVRVEPAGTTADRLVTAGDDLDLDGWVTPGPWPAVARAVRTRIGKQPGMHVSGPPLARARLVIAVWPDRAGVCGGDIGWACLVKAAASPSFRLGLPDARRDALGLVALGSAAQSLAPEDPLNDDGFRGALDALDRAVPRPLPPFATVLSIGPALADAYVVAESAGGRDRMTLAYPAPVVTADVMVGDVRGDRGERADALLRSKRVRDALVQAGWRTDLGALDSGLPPADVLEALRVLWTEVAR